MGQLEQASVSGETARDYIYDAFGRRVSTKVGSAETQFLYHGWHMIGEFDQTNSEWLWQEVPMNRGEGMLEHIALDANDLDTDSNTTEYRQYAVQEDWQNTVWALSDTSGAVVERYEQDDPFGASHTLDSTGTDIGVFASNVFHRKRMHGGVIEEVTGLYDFRNRWLSPESRDPLGSVDSENLFLGIGANPLNMRDSSGLRAERTVKTGYGELRVRADVTNGGSADFPNSCKGKAGCTSLGCSRTGTEVNCLIHVRVDCAHADSQRLGCDTVADHEVQHGKNYKACVANANTGIPAILDDLKSGRIDGATADELISELTAWCGEQEQH